MEIRDAVIDDAKSIGEVYLDSFLTAYARITTKEYLSTRNLADCIDQWSRNICDDSMSVIVAESNNAIEGVASFSQARDHDVDRDKNAELQAIYVSPSRWTHGIGRELCSHVIHRLYSGGASSILLWVLSDNVRATHFYERLGFKADGTSKTVGMGYELAAVRYRHTPS